MNSTEFIIFKIFICLIGALFIYLPTRLDDEAIKRRYLNIFISDTWLGTILIVITNGLIKKMPPKVIRLIFLIVGILIILLGFLIQYD